MPTMLRVSLLRNVPKLTAPAAEAPGVARQCGAADPGFAIELRSAVEAGEPRPPPRLGGRGRGHLLERGMVRRLGLFGRGIWQRLAGKGDAVDVDRFAVTPERALIHHDRREHAGGAERGLLRCAHAFAGERVHGCRKLGGTEAEQTGQGPTAGVERGVERGATADWFSVRPAIWPM